MTMIPLFPLNMVLFPGMQLRLHIFEERYKQMVNECRASGEPFGIVMIEDGAEVGFSATPHRVGCTAQITQISDLPNGNMDIVVVGEERFRIVELFGDRPYLYGTVEMLPDMPQGETKANTLRHLVISYLDILQQAADVQFNSSQIPTNPPTVAYLASMLLQIDDEEKQALLEIEPIDQLISTLTRLYRREVTLLDNLVSPAEILIDGTAFSLN
ncbi:LON peptidase substrate-binding domain-containing protein [Phototrophicus methaneseepsis]|uniref:LON peptidase substrate-binding domain-containing protein n=1 Tax=Phototrophicus methaneseepsis TaxID=2710758 RepID=A0A7S8E608_9CHLR|nr:LON peptidase substrate-binding domain-containing protein [Phototrophicus methaneseepsis]QPC80990.1 LON peptidase substrate-binding domain-containing protein [Phototrophicus methaneseepsis]